MVELIKLILTRRMIAVLFLGLSSGLPLLLIGSTLKAWLKDCQFSLETIGIFTSVGIPYAFKFLWAPFLDRFGLKIFDRRRGWIFVFQLILAGLFVCVAYTNPSLSYYRLYVLSILIAFFSASQDIVIDAYRREVLEDRELALGSSLAVSGYRVGMLLSGAFVLYIADSVGWKNAYCIMASVMLASVFFTIIAPKVDTPESVRSMNIVQTVFMPFVEFLKRKGAFYILVFILLYKIGDQLASDMIMPFYMEMGFLKKDIGLISKFYGIFATLLGGFLGGAILLKIKLRSGLIGFGILQMLSTACFCFLVFWPTKLMLGSVVVFENLSSGMGSSAYVAFMGMLCNKKFTATQYALLSSLMILPTKLFGSYSGYLVSYMGWINFFLFCAAIAIPGIVMLFSKKWWQ